MVPIENSVQRLQGTIQYIQLVKELTKEPDYEALLSALKKLR
jgi:hypothetical protein